MSIKEEPTHCLHIEEEVDGKPWYYDVLQYVIVNTPTMLLKMIKEY